MKQPYLSIVTMLPLQMKTNFVAAVCGILFASACIYICWWYMKLIRTYEKFPSVRFEVKYLTKMFLGKFPNNVPFTSVILDILIEEANQFQKEGIFVAWFFRPYLVIFNKEIVKRLYADPATVNKSSMYNLFKDGFGNGLLTSKGEIWKKHRKLLDPAFYVGVLKSKLNIFNEAASELVTELEKRIGQPTSDLEKTLKKCSLHSLFQIILGLNLDDENYKEELVNYFNAVHDFTSGFVYRLSRPWLYWKRALPFTSEGRKYIRARDYMRHFTLKVLSEQKTSVVASVEPDEDLGYGIKSKTSFVRILLDQHLKDPTFTMDDVLDHITTIIAAGHDTISYTLIWCLYMLGLHPEVQEKAFKEIDALTGADITYEGLCQLKYLECVIKETLRLYPTIPIYGRKLDKDICMGDWTIPNGAETVFFIYQLHRRPDLFPDPQKFDPERFSWCSEVSPYAFIPFAEGYRNCIGKKFAMMETKVILAHVIRRFKIETLEKIDSSHLDWKITLSPAKPVPVRITLR